MLKYLRERDGLSQSELAEKMGLSKATIGMYESGRREPNFETEEKLADFFYVTLDVLRGIDTENTDEYYIDPKAAAAAQKMMTNTRLKALFEAAANSSDEDLHTTYNMLMALKRKDTHEDE